MLKCWHSVSNIFSGWDIQDLVLQNGAKNLVRNLQVGLGSDHSLPRHVLRLLFALIQSLQMNTKMERKKNRDS